MDDIRVPTPDDVAAAAQASYALLAPLADRDWSATTGDLEWDCRTTLEHVAGVQLFYAIHAASQAMGRLPAARTGNPEQSVADLIEVHRAQAVVLAEALRAMPDTARGWHPAGMADRYGFAAMSCTEILVHTNDIAQGLGVEFTPPDGVAARTIARLFPWVQVEGNPWQTLLYAAGRRPLGEMERRAPNWSWQCAPLSEWNGEVRVRGG
ncbi:MAG: maleylpyruvate isomerase family mycothiol-dependent enzyme [Chloroflexota bacterium]|nr:maleylpyruvate isomerase family mycothiol-dependent enzyme [Chloroflexota bacterium]MDE2969824.1 maleylpyruvate isomerase family mycothiol-dependent enzyme [Chloroflexota bacterium]